MALALAATVGGGCAGAVTPAPTEVPVTPAPTASPTPRPTPTPLPSLDGLPWPTEGNVAMPPGRYASLPPFDVPFTLEVVGDGWRSDHLLGEFFDLVRLEDAAAEGLPQRWLAFAHPARIRGAAGSEVTAAQLSPAEAVERYQAREDLTASEATPFEVGPWTGLRLDLVAESPSTILFGGAEGNFGMQPELDVRLGILAIEDGLLLVLVLAPPGELEAAWAETEPILASVEAP